MEIAFCYADLENPPVTTPEKLTAFSKITSLEIKDLVSPAQVYGKNNFGGLAHFYYSSDALKYYLEDQSQTKLPMIIHPYFDLNKSTLIWKVISADGDRIYLSNPQELHDSLQRILLFEQRNSHE
ncbi:MAG: hypothetical protein HRT88_10700 [Lentisphaeraceae bacterium]|nr:hypothetical protein [Lentisphaeraceae bacterium]